MEPLSDTVYKALEPLAKRYVWWKSAQEALSIPEHSLAHIMNLGTFEDIQTLLSTVDEECLKIVLSEALPGWFSNKSWHYWHYKLRMASKPSQIPQIPIRRFS